MAPAVCLSSDPGQASITPAPLKTKASQKRDCGAYGTFDGKLSVLMPKAAGRGRGLHGGNSVPCRKQTEGTVIGLGLSQPRSCHTP